MSPALAGEPTTAVEVTGQPTYSRVVSLDIFRGLTMTLMIFVNELANVHGLSRWTYHMPTNVDAMSYVDVVFPAFLFIVGMALPLAVRQRLNRNASLPSLWGHVLVRTLSLVCMGLILANGAGGDATHMHGLPPSLWTLIALTGAVLLWGVFGDSSRPARTALRPHHGMGALLLIACFAIFRRVAPDGHTAWIDFSYPEILGLIGLSYLAACILYIPFRHYRWAPLAWLIALLAFDAACMAHVISIARLPMYIWPFDNGSMPAMIMAGILANTLFFNRDQGWSAYRRIRIALVAAAVTGLAGYLMVPFGISKNRGTPTWSLWSITACLVVFSLLYWVCDIRKHTAWAAPIRSAGSNTLMTYLLPDFYVYLAAFFGFTSFLLRWSYGWPGVLRAILFTVVMLLLSNALTRLRIRMQI